MTVPYDEIPYEALVILEDFYDRTDAAAWWNSPNPALGNERPRDVPERGIALLHALADGAFL